MAMKSNGIVYVVSNHARVRVREARALTLLTGAAFAGTAAAVAVRLGTAAKGVNGTSLGGSLRDKEERAKFTGLSSMRRISSPSKNFGSGCAQRLMPVLHLGTVMISL